MIFFKTLFFPCSTAEAHAIEDRLGMPRFLTINGEAPVVMSSKGMALLRSLEQQRIIKIRNKLIKTGTMSKGFEMAIAEFLNKEAAFDPLFGAKMKEHPEKDVKAVCDYLLNEVSKKVSEGAGGFADDEIFGMAKHFIVEDELKPQAFRGKVKVVTNRHVELSKKEKEDAKKAAIEEYKLEVRKKAEQEEKERAFRAAEKAKELADKKKQEAVEKAKKLEKMQPSLFGDDF